MAVAGQRGRKPGGRGEMSTGQRQQGSSLQILDRTFAILGVFGPGRSEWSATEVAHELDLPIPTVHRLLIAITRHGYLRQDPDTKRFRLGQAAFTLGQRAHDGVDVRLQALPTLRALTHVTGETSLLTGLNDERNRGICLERVESSRPLRFSLTPGRQMPLHAGASQKALAAFLPPAAMERLLESPRERLCSDTIVGREALEHEFSRIRRNGWASSSSETDVAVSGIAVPIFDLAGNVVYALGVAGPSARFTPEYRDELINQTRIACADFAAAIGASTQQDPQLAGAADIV